MTWKITLCLVLITSTISSGAAAADEPSPAGPVSQAQIKTLIRQLGDRDTSQRDAAAQRLIEIGRPAKAQLKAASEDSNELAVIRHRAKVLLLSIRRRERAFGWNTFISGKSDDPPPGWEKFCQAAGGDTAAARKLFVGMYRAEPELLETYVTDLRKAAWLVESRCSAWAVARLRMRKAVSKIPIGSVMACLWVVGDRKVSVSNRASHELFLTMGLRRPGNPNVPFAVAWNNGPGKSILRKLVARWMLKVARQLHDIESSDRYLCCSMLKAALVHDLEEGLPIALALLSEIDLRADRDLELREAHAIKLSICAIGKLGEACHVQRLEPLLKNSLVLSKSSEGAIPQVRDVALFALIYLTGQKTKDYGIATIDVKSSIRAHLFANAEQRERALAKWNKWRTENLQDGDK